MADSWEDDDFEPVAVASVPVVSSVPPEADDESDGGNWDDDDFVAPVVTQKARNDDEEEEDLAFEELNKKETAGAPKKVQEALLRKQAAEEAAILNKVQAGGLKGETAEQKRLRERKQQEESDFAQALDAFGGFTVKTEQTEKATKEVFSQLTKGIGSVVLKTKQDHTNFGFNTHVKLLASKPEHLAAFYNGLSEVLNQSTFTLAILAPIILGFTKMKETTEKRNRATGGAPVTRSGAAKVEEAPKPAAVADDADDDWLGGDDDDYGDMAVTSKAQTNNKDSEDDLLGQQHRDYGVALSLKLARSTPQNIAAFYAALNDLLVKVEWTLPAALDVYDCMFKIQAAREKVESKLPKVKSAKDTKLEKLKKEKRAKEIYGDSEYVNEYDVYSSMEDRY